MSQMDTAIIFLGNPTAEYESTRHNLGFMAGDILAGKLKCRFGPPPQPAPGSYLLAKRQFRGRSLHLVKPTTFMNLSGLAVAEVIKRNNVTPSDLIVVCDDFALELGRIRIRNKGSDGGHNGLKSIIETLATGNFARIRLGIGPVPNNVDPADFVLAKIELKGINTLRDLADRASEATLDLVNRGFAFAANKYNQKPSAPAEPNGGAE